VSLEEDDEQALMQEVDILSQLDHPIVVKLFEIFDEANTLSLVMEIMTGGEVLIKINIVAIRSNCGEGALL
jgi:serine/threonine protein kinase